MDLSKYKNLHDCRIAIETLKSLGVPVPQELLDLCKKYEDAQSPKSRGAIESGPIYPHFCKTVPYSVELQKCIESTVEKLMQDGADAEKPGLLLGKIQCGKTRAFVGVIGLAFDKGFDACVVFTKGTNALISQTVTRLKYDFRDYKKSNNMNQYCTVSVYDIMKKKSGLGGQQIKKQKNIIVCKKEHTNIEILIDVFTNKSPELCSKRILIIDDEADFVTRSFTASEQIIKQGTNGLLIDRFIGIQKYCRYLQVTATPYSLYLQPDCSVEVSNGVVRPFKPRFTELVPIHANYVGGKQYFVDSKNDYSMYSHLFHSVSDDCFDYMLSKNRDRRILNNIATTSKMLDLRWAVMSYLVASAIRQIQEEQHMQRSFQSSFIIHVCTDRESHEWQCALLKKLLDSWKTDLSLQEDLFHEVYRDLLESSEKGLKEALITCALPEKNMVWDRIKRIFEDESCYVQMVNSDTDVNALLDENGQLDLSHDLNIFVGGYILDRGITIEHMLGFMYGRRPQKGQQDTVLQHCRMYGNRSKEDMAVTRFHTTFALHDIMTRIDEMDEQLREWFVNPTNEDPSAVFVRLSDKNDIVPCNSGKLIISNLTTLKPFKRITTFGFQTDCKTNIKPIIEDIDRIITSQDYYVKDKVFELSVDVVLDILYKIRKTYVYDRDIDENEGYDWDVNEMVGCIKYATRNTNGKMLCLHRVNRNMSRKRSNGNFVDAPEDGNTDTPLARAAAIDMPVIMLLRQNGEVEKGWRGTPFYWPALRMPHNILPAVFSSNE